MRNQGRACLQWGSLGERPLTSQAGLGAPLCSPTFQPLQLSFFLRLKFPCMLWPRLSISFQLLMETLIDHSPGRLPHRHPPTLTRIRTHTLIQLWRRGWEQLGNAFSLTFEGSKEMQVHFQGLGWRGPTSAPPDPQELWPDQSRAIPDSLGTWIPRPALHLMRNR